jgi:hypothetical protein
MEVECYNDLMTYDENDLRMVEKTFSSIPAENKEELCKKLTNYMMRKYHTKKGNMLGYDISLSYTWLVDSMPETFYMVPFVSSLLPFLYSALGYQILATVFYPVNKLIDSIFKPDADSEGIFDFSVNKVINSPRKLIKLLLSLVIFLMISAALWSYETELDKNIATIIATEKTTADAMAYAFGDLLIRVNKVIGPKTLKTVIGDDPIQWTSIINNPAYQYNKLLKDFVRDSYNTYMGSAVLQVTGVGTGLDKSPPYLWRLLELLAVLAKKVMKKGYEVVLCLLTYINVVILMFYSQFNQNMLGLEDTGYLLIEDINEKLE